MAQEGINTRWLDNDNMWNLSLFTKGYSLMNEMLYNLSLEHNAGYLNAQAIVDDMGKKAVYYDSVHLTAIANEVLAEELSKEVSRYIE